MRVKLCEKYKIEREEICKKLINVLKLDEKKSFLLCDLDLDIEKQNAILTMKEEIQKYFSVSSISAFKTNKECKRPYLNIVRGILKQEGYFFEGNNNVINLENGESKITKKYYIFSRDSYSSNLWY